MIVGAGVTDVDLGDPQFIADPYPVLAELRAQGPVLWHEGTQRWLATSHAAVSMTLRDRRFDRIWVDAEPAQEMKPFNDLHRYQLMESVGADHRRMRTLVAGAFARGHVDRLRPRIAKLADELAAELPSEADIIAHYAEPLPVFVIADLLGVPRADHRLLRDWSQAIVAMYETDLDDAVRSAATQASAEFASYVRSQIDQRRTQPSSDLISGLIAEAAEGHRLSDDELVATVVLLLNAGHEASVNTFGNGLYALLRHPDQAVRVLGGEVPIDDAIEELIRYDSALQLFERTATADVEVAGITIRAGQKVACLMGAANRDPQAFADPDMLDVGRRPSTHVGFGLGAHFCLGAPLARAEFQLSLAALFNRFPRLSLSGEPARRPSWVLRGFERMDLSMEEAA